MTDTRHLQEAFAKGQQAQSNGDLATARETFDSILSTDPDNAEVLHALAVLDLQEGLLEQAERRLQAALKINRYGVGYQNSLGDLRIAQNRLRDAEAAYFEELRMRPDFAVSHLKLGNLMMRIGNFQRAVKHFHSTLQFAPESAVAANRLGMALLRLDEFSKAADSFKRALFLHPGLCEAQANLGLVKLRVGELYLAAECFAAALSLDKGCASAHKGVGLLMAMQGKPTEAIAAFKKCLDIDDADQEAYLELARVLRDQGARQLALQYFERARELAPMDVELLNEIAAVQVWCGDFAGAGRNFEKALQLRPSHQRSLIGYGRIKAHLGDTKIALAKLSSAVHSGRTSTEVLRVYALLLGRSGRGREGIAVLERQLRKKMPSAEKSRVHFTLGKLLDADSSYDLAFHHFRIANEINRKVFDARKFKQTCDGIIEGFTADALGRAARAESTSDNLVFLVGLPRSGLRTLELLIAGQEGVLDLGACNTIELSAYRMSTESNTSWPLKADQPTQDTLTRLAEAYASQLCFQPGEDYDVVLDATWRNFLYIGVIELLFPGARIVYCTRDARDIALSTFFNDLQSEPGLSYASSMSDIASFINAHKRVMAHWCDNGNLPMHIVSYERMILDYEDEFGALLQFLTLADEGDKPDIAAKQKLPKPSFLRSTSLRRYRHYRAHLEGLISALEVPPDKVF